ncbi:MAG: carbohydrate ABC transporter permease [Granulosicoccus sp.]
MSPFGLIMWVVCSTWVLYGSYWLLTNRLYRWSQAHHFIADLVGFPVEWAQSTWGRGGVPYALLMPNMLIFGIFTFSPLLLNLYVSFTGGESINLFERPVVGLENYRQIFDCDTILIPKTCPAAGYNFWTGLGNTFFFVVFQVPVLCVVSLITALVVNRVIRGRGFWRAMFFYPVMLSPVVIANIWKWVLHRRGALNSALDAGDETAAALSALAGFDILATIIVAIVLLLATERALRSDKFLSLPWAFLMAVLILLIVTWSHPLSLIPGSVINSSLWLGVVLAGWLLWLVADQRAMARKALIGACIVGMLLLLGIQFDAVFNFGEFRPVNWLVTPRSGWPMFWLIFVYTWHHMGFYMLILLAGLQAIPRDLYEAAEMDAASPWRTFSRITFPLLMPTFIVVLVLSLIKSFQVFDEVYTLTGGGPGRETFMVVQYIFESAFTGANRSYGPAAAGSVIMAVILALLTTIQLVATRRQSGV